MKKKIKNNQKSFFFEDYTEVEIKNENKKKIKISLNRVTFLFFVFFALIIIFSSKTIYLSLSPQKNLFFQKSKNFFTSNRQDIVDRNGTILARNILI